MSTHNTELDSINNICSLVKEIIELANEVSYDLPDESFKDYQATVFHNVDLIVSKANTIKSKAQAMENRLKEYRSAIQSLGFKRIKEKKCTQKKI